MRAIRATPDVAARWPDEEGFPLTDEPEATRFVVLLRDPEAPGGRRSPGARARAVRREDTADYRHASIDIFLDPEIHRHGYGREVITVVAKRLFDERGHHRITIDPAADNAAAIACYAAVGFRPVGVMRQYERSLDGTFHDGWLMDLLSAELVIP